MQSGHGWHKPSRGSANTSGRRSSRPAGSSSVWRKEISNERRTRAPEQARIQVGETGGILPRRFDVARMASTATPQLQALLLWSEHLPDRQLDDTVGDNLAGLSPHPFGAAAWRR